MSFNGRNIDLSNYEKNVLDCNKCWAKPSLMLSSCHLSIVWIHGPEGIVIVPRMVVQQQFWMVINKHGLVMQKGVHCLSISLRISLACAWPCIKTRYFLTQVTRWSLKTPLMSWCSRSGEIILWISAWGKSFVKGYIIYVSIVKSEWDLNILLYCQWHHIHPTKCLIQIHSQLVLYAHGNTARHLHQDCFCLQCIYRTCKIDMTWGWEIYLTVGTTLVQCRWGEPALDSQQYILQDYRLCMGNGHWNLWNFESFAYDLSPFKQQSVVNLYKVVTHFLELQEKQSRPGCHSVLIRCYYEQNQWKCKEDNIHCGQLQPRLSFCHCQGLWVQASFHVLLGLQLLYPHNKKLVWWQGEKSIKHTASFQAQSPDMKC